MGRVKGDHGENMERTGKLEDDYVEKNREIMGIL